MNHSPRGFTLFIAMILSAVILSVGIALLDISYKQVILASGAKNSAIAFYNADAAMECTLYWDTKGTFDYYTSPTSGTFVCQQQTVTFRAPAVSGGTTRITTFSVPCAGGGGGSATSTIYKAPSGATTVYVTGYDGCNQSNPRRIERGIKAQY